LGREIENPSHRGTLTIFSDFRALVAAVQRLASTVEDLGAAQRELAPARVRLEALELSRHQFEAQIEGVLLKAEGKLKAANNSEARERQLKRSYESQLDSFNPDGKEGHEEGVEPQAVFSDDAQAGKEERMRALRLDVAPDHKALALRYKFGVGA